jgi:chromosome segregation ATPase
MSLLNSKKLKELQSENEELKKRIDGLAEKENRLRHFDELVKRARIEYAEIATKKDQTAQKLDALDRDKVKLIGELNKISLEINQLREIKLTESNQVFSLSNALDNSNQHSKDKNDESAKSKILHSNEIAAAEKRKYDIALETFQIGKKFDVINNKITDGKIVLDRLNAEIEKKKEEISSLMNKKMSVSHEQIKNFSLTFKEQDAEEIQTRIADLHNKEKELIEKFNSHRRQLDELDRRIEKKKLNLGSELDINDSLDRLSQTESVKQEHFLELEIKIESQEALLTSLNEELKAKTELYNELQSENKQLAEDLQSGQEKLGKLNESIEIETIRLTDLDYSLNILEQEFDNLGKDISEKTTIKEEIELQINERTNQKVDLEDLLKELRETTSVLAQLKNDIEKGTGQSAKRFTGVLQYYSSMINDIYKKKTTLEKSLNQKYKEFKEKQILIEEKKFILEEMENVLFVRHQRIKLFEDLTHSITNQRKILESNAYITEDLKQRGNVVFNNDIPQKKLLEFENALNELLYNSDKYSGNLISTKSLLEKEITDNKNRLNELNQNIRNSTSEFYDLRNSITKIKNEHEEHRVSINKLASIKTKLEEGINKDKLIIDKYTAIKEKIRQEQEIIKMKRELVGSIKSSKQIFVGEKTFGPQNPKWIKL